MADSHDLAGRLNRAKPRRENIADKVYAHLKAEIFAFRLLPGDRFTENDVADLLQVSRTPVREALYRLQDDGYVLVSFRSGWQVRPFDFNYFEELYDVRIILEEAAVRRLCATASTHEDFLELLDFWLVPESARCSDFAFVSHKDERFHNQLVSATGNHEMTVMHQRITDRIRIIRRLDFTQSHRVAATYDEHSAILRAIQPQDPTLATGLLNSHITASKAEVRKITLHKLHTAREQMARDMEIA